MKPRRHVLKNMFVWKYVYKLKLLSGDKSRLTNRLRIKLTLKLLDVEGVPWFAQ